MSKEYPKGGTVGDGQGGGDTGTKGRSRRCETGQGVCLSVCVRQT
jgi:hypothetical protein